MIIILGEISIDWADDEISKNLPIEAPVLGILHTITGSSRQNAGFMQYAARRGWRSCVLNRFVNLYTYRCPLIVNKRFMLDEMT